MPSAVRTQKCGSAGFLTDFWPAKWLLSEHRVEQPRSLQRDFAEIAARRNWPASNGELRSSIRLALHWKNTASLKSAFRKWPVFGGLKRSIEYSDWDLQSRTLGLFLVVIGLLNQNTFQVRSKLKIQSSSLDPRKFGTSKRGEKSG